MAAMGPARHRSRNPKHNERAQNDGHSDLRGFDQGSVTGDDATHDQWPDQARHGQRDPEQRRNAELGPGESHRQIVPSAGIASQEPPGAQHLPAVRRRAMLITLRRAPVLV